MTVGQPIFQNRLHIQGRISTDRIRLELEPGETISVVSGHTSFRSEPQVTHSVLREAYNYTAGKPIDPTETTPMSTSRPRRQLPPHTCWR